MTIFIPSPAVGLTVDSEGAGVSAASGDRLETDAGWHLDGDWDAGVGGRVVAQLTILIPSPAVGMTSGGEGAGVEVDRSNLTK